MEYKKAQNIIEKIVKNFCSRFNIFHLYEDLKSVGNTCYLKCKKKFKEGDFKKYFISALKNEFYKFLREELRYENLRVDIEDIEEVFAEERGDDLKLRIAEFTESLSEKEKRVVFLFSENYSLSEISEILGISYKRVKDVGVR